MTVIDHAVISRYKVWDEVVSHVHGEGYLPTTQPPPTSEARTSTQPPKLQSSSARPMADIFASLTLLHQKVDRQSWRIDIVAQRQDLMMQYQEEFAITVDNIYSSSSGDESEEMPFQFPVPLVFPQYPPPSPTMEEDDDGEGID